MKRLVAAAFAVGAMTLAPLARANGRLPAANQLVVAPDDPASLLLRTTFGMLVSHDAGQTWDWLCESAIPVSGQQDPAVALLAGGAVLSGEIEGLALSPDRGCSWSFVPGTAKELAVDVARAPNGTTAIAATNVYAGTDGGTLLYTSQMLQTTNAGQTWAPLPGAIDPTLALDTIDLAPNDPQRMYITGQPFGADHGTILVSKDGGQSYQPFVIPFVSGETGAFIAAIDPNDADRVYVRTLGTSDAGLEQFSRLLVSKDGGQTWQEAWSGDKMLGFALSADGSRVYVGSALAGLVAANASDLVFAQKSPLQIQCLTTSGSTLYVCANEANALALTGSGFIIGATTDEGATFQPLVKLETIRGPIQCPAGTAATACADQWPALAQQLGADAGAPAQDAGPTSSARGCGCESSTPTALDALYFAGIGAILLGLSARRRRLTLRSRPSRGAR